MDDKINNASPDTKDALIKIKDFNSKLSKFVQLSSAYNEDSTKEEKAEIIKARKELNAVKDKITPFLLQKAGMATKDNSEDLAATFANDVKDALAEYEELESMGDVTAQVGSKETETEVTANDDTIQDTSAASDDEALKQAEDAKTTAKEKYDSIKDGDDKKSIIQAKIAFLQAQQKIAKIKKDNELYQGLGDEIGEEMQKLS